MKDPGFAKFVLLVNGSIPLALLAWDAYHKRLGADPVLFAIHTTGMTALIFLMLSLAITPARKITGWNWLSHFRRMLGLFAFFYGAIHLILYFGFNRQFDVAATFTEVLSKPFILFGMIALLLMVPLAITSTNSMIKRLGAARWKRLHQLAYIAAISAMVHFFYSAKTVTLQIKSFIVILAVLLGYRLFVWASRRGDRKPSVAA
jgi:DMSO/TMAO reductase YedYZ heme-binding membrane subunit